MNNINTDETDDISFDDTIYKLEHKQHTSHTSIQYVLYDEQPSIYNNSYQIYFKNAEFFADEYILLQEIDNRNAPEPTNAFIDNLYIEKNKTLYSTHCITLRNIKIAVKLRNEMTNYKFFVQIIYDKNHKIKQYITISETKLFKINKRPMDDLSDEEDSDLKNDFFLFDKIEQFQIPLLLQTTNIGFTISLFVEPLNGAFESKKIKSFYMCFPKYVINEDIGTALVIDTVIDVSKSDVFNDGMIQIYSSSTIFINDDGVIRNMFEQDDDKHNDLKYKGLILLSSTKSIVINGVLSANSTNGGRIVLLSEQSIINDGEILCGANGKVFICCKSFINNGCIDVKPIITNNQIQDESSLLRKNIYLPKFPWEVDMVDAAKIKLTIFKHRGHYNNQDIHSPQNLLSVSRNKYTSKQGVTSGDWIIFQIQSKKKKKIVYPTKVRIKNSRDDASIRDIALFVGKSDKNHDHNHDHKHEYKINKRPMDDLSDEEDGVIEWYQLCKDIKNIHIYHEVQDFVIGDKLLLSSYFLWQHQFDLIKIEILKNHGWDRENCFHEFSLFGVELSTS